MDQVVAGSGGVCYNREVAASFLVKYQIILARQYIIDGLEGKFLDEDFKCKSCFLQCYW